jgi:tetratricopeptide (TPR) repeat protein
MKRPSIAFLAALGVGLVYALPARADADGNARNAQTEISTVDRESGTVQSAIDKAKAQRYTVEQRLANGELLYRSKDYARASVVFSEIIEEFPGTPSYPDALWLRGETYYASKEYLSARRDYRQLVERGTESRFSPYFGRALARWVDVCLRTGDIKGLDEVFTRLNQVPPAQVDAGLSYAKGKAYYAKQDYTQSMQSFQAVPNQTPFTHQARYFQGLVAMKTTAPGRPASADGKTRAIPANYKQAIEAFHAVTQLPPDSDEHRHVIDLSWMAIGRLYYEMEQYTQASEAYAKVGRDSPVFDTMLYELAWVYVRLGDVQRAERALEVLSIADPSSPLVGDGTLLRADLLLRAGAFDKALQLYEGVRGQYDPLRQRVEDFLDKNKDNAVFYDKLSQQTLDTVDAPDQLPPLAIRWAREAEDGPLAFAVIDDVNTCKSLIKQSYALIDKLTAITEASNRVRAFPELAAGEEKALGLINRLSKARLEIARGLDEQEPGDLGGEMGEVRARRRELMGQVGQLPTGSSDFNDREVQGLRQWNTVSQGLTQRNHEIDSLQATINGLRRMLKDDAARGVARDSNTLARFNTELDENERLLKLYQQQAVELRKQIEFGRFQIGIGDARYQRDAQDRVAFRDLLEREAQLAAQGQAGGSAQRYAQQVQGALTQARTVEDRLVQAFAQIEAQVQSKIGELRGKIEAERLKIVGYSQQLDALDNESKDLVGLVARRNFEFVRDKLRSIVLRADVGITEQAWEVREEQLDRVHNLQAERARQEHLLDEELREVLDDAGDAQQPGTKK